MVKTFFQTWEDISFFSDFYIFLFHKCFFPQHLDLFFLGPLLAQISILMASEAMRRTVERSQEFCDEAQKYMDLIAMEEADARRPQRKTPVVFLELDSGWLC